MSHRLIRRFMLPNRCENVNFWVTQSQENSPTDAH